MIGAATRRGRSVVGNHVGVELMHADFFHRHFELFRRDLRKNRVAALADLHGAREHGHFALGIDCHAGIRCRRRARRFLDASEAFADLNARLGLLRRFAPIDGFRGFDECFFEANGMQLFAPIGRCRLR